MLRAVHWIVWNNPITNIFFSFFLISFNCVWSLALGACSLLLAGSGDRELWSLQLLSIDRDPRAKLLPAVGHDLELSGDGQQLSCGGVAYFYCEFFHCAKLTYFLSIIFLKKSLFSLEYMYIKSPGLSKPFNLAFSNALLLSLWYIFSFITSSYHLWDRLSSLQLVAWSLQLFSFF